jgi:hypothetical protein
LRLQIAPLFENAAVQKFAQPPAPCRRLHHGFNRT